MKFTGVLSDHPILTKAGCFNLSKLRKPFRKIKTEADFIEYSYVYMNGTGCFIPADYACWGMLKYRRQGKWEWSFYLPEEPGVYAGFKYKSKPSRAEFKRDLVKVGEWFDKYFDWEAIQVEYAVLDDWSKEHQSQPSYYDVAYRPAPRNS